MNQIKISLYICLILAFTLSACQAAPAAPATGEPTQEEAPAEQPSEQKTFEFWDYAGPYIPWMKDFIAKYQSEHPGITIKYTTIPEVDYDEKLRTAMAAGSEPDILFQISGSSLSEYANAGKVIALDSLVDKSLWTPSTLSALTYDGKLYAIPLGPMISPMWYNVKLFKENNIAVPTTWEQLLDTCNAFNKKGITPISFAMLERWEVMVYYDYFQHQLAGPGVMDKAAHGQGASFSDPQFIEAAERLQELFNAKCFPEGTASLDSNQMAASFFNEEAAMIELGTWIIGMAKDQAPEDFEMSSFLFPALPNNISGTEQDVLGGVNSFAISARCKHPEEAAKFLTAFGEANSDFVNASGYLPSVPGVKVDNVLTNQLIGYFENAGTLYIWGDRRLPTAIVDDYLDNLVALAVGEMTPEEFGAKMDAAVQQKVK
jgi:raffinose/stachyose/melibiose transport system substrate-binding protein